MFRQALLVTACAAAALALFACGGSDDPTSTPAVSSQDALQTATPIKHVVVIYGENISFDHYFGTYPNATNPSGEPAFTAKSGTPTPNGLTGTLLTANPNFTNTANGTDAANPFRLDRTQAATADQNHAYTAEQQAEDNGPPTCSRNTPASSSGGAGAFGTKGQVMGYFDGNTVTALGTTRNASR